MAAEHAIRKTRERAEVYALFRAPAFTIRLGIVVAARKVSFSTTERGYLQAARRPKFGATKLRETHLLRRAVETAS
jgi:hypothetical protein